MVFSFPGPKKCGRWDCKIPLGVFMQQQLEGRESVMAVWLEAYLLGLEAEGPGHCLVKVSTAVFNPHHITDVSPSISSTTLTCIKLLYFYFTTSSVPSSFSEGQQRQVITILA